MGVTGSGGIRIWRALKEGEQAGVEIASWAKAVPTELVGAWNRAVTAANAQLESAGRACIEKRIDTYSRLFGPVKRAARAIGLQFVYRFKSGYAFCGRLGYLAMSRKLTLYTELHTV